MPNVGVHGLRHTAARMRRRLGISVEDLQEFLEHDNIDTTMIYVKETEAKEDEGWVQVAVLLGLSEQPGQEDPSTPVTPAVWDDRTSVLAASFLAEVPSMDEVVRAGITGAGAACGWTKRLCALGRRGPGGPARTFRAGDPGASLGRALARRRKRG